MVGLQKRNHQKGICLIFIILGAILTHLYFWDPMGRVSIFFGRCCFWQTCDLLLLLLQLLLKIPKSNMEIENLIFMTYTSENHTLHTYLITLFYSSKIYSHGQDKSDTNRITTRLYFIHFIYLRMRVVMSYSYAH